MDFAPADGTSGVPSYYALSYYPDAGTELVALALEFDVPDKPSALVDWPEGKSKYDPRYMATLLQALRPDAYRQAGLTLPTLLR